MINRIRDHSQLKKFITDRCEENKISTSMENDISPHDYLVIKVDEFYNSLRLSDTPASIDCLLVLKCTDSSYMIYLIELKNIRHSRDLKFANTKAKFKTTIEDFMESRFKNIFLDENYIIKQLHLYLISKIKISRAKEGTTKIDRLSSEKPFRFRGKIYQFEHKSPDPVIKKC